jgi:uncharacterized protein HemX
VPERPVRLAALALVVLALTAPPAAAQDPGTTTTSLPQVPTQEIVPQPNTGTAPEDAGDRGGALQLTLLGLVVVAIGGAVVVVVRQSRRARQAADR